MIKNIGLFIVGFFWNLIHLLIFAIPMSVDSGSLCVREKKLPWDIPEEDFGPKLEEEAGREE